MSDDVTTAATISSLRAEVERLTAENERLTNNAIKELIDGWKLREFEYKNHDHAIEASAIIQSPFMGLIGEWLAADFRRTGAVNFLEQELTFTARDSEHRYTVNIRKSGGKTEAQVCGELRAALADRNAYAERLLAENVRLSNRQSMDREEIESMGRRNDELTKALWTSAEYVKRLESDVARLANDKRGLLDEMDEMRDDEDRADSLSNSIITACTGSGCLNAHELRVALDTARERAGVLEAEVRAWRRHDDVHECEPESEGLRRQSIEAHDMACRAAQETDRRNALDAAKFGGA